jgi:hypothetical protein
LTSSTTSETRVARARARAACAFCLQLRNLRRTLRIALVVGIVLTAINQGDVIAGGDATAATWVRCALNFVVPFLVSNAGLLSARR